MQEQQRQQQEAAQPPRQAETRSETRSGETVTVQAYSIIGLFAIFQLLVLLELTFIVTSGVFMDGYNWFASMGAVLAGVAFLLIVLGWLLACFISRIIRAGDE